GSVEALIERFVPQLPESLRAATSVVAIAREPVPVDVLRRVSQAVRSNSEKARPSGRSIEDYGLLIPIRLPDGTDGFILPASSLAPLFSRLADRRSAHMQIVEELRRPSAPKEI